VRGRPARLIGYALALGLALAGCGSSAQRTQTTTSTTAAGAGQGPTVRFTGGYLPGTVYMGAGPDELSLDAYRLSGSLSKTERLTYSPVGLGIQGLGANQHDVVINRICCGGLNFMEQLNLDRRGGLPGAVLGNGNAEAIAPDGQLAYIIQNYPGCKCDALLVRPSLLGTSRIIYREPHPAMILSAVWSAGDRLAAMIGTYKSDGTLANNEIVLYPGTAQQRIINPGAMLDVESGLWWGPHGELSYEVTGPRLVVRFSSGQTRSFLLGNWHATCWLPNDTIFAVNLLKDALGMLDPATGGTVKTIGGFPNEATLYVLDCPH
jgi:hypothetical protein